jgi:hypothetical protein
VFRFAVGGDGSDDESPVASVDETEVIFSSEALDRLAQSLLRQLQAKAGLDGGPLDSILVTDSDVARALASIENPVTDPFVSISASLRTQIALTLLVDRCRAVPFRVSEFCCLKLPPVDTDAPHNAAVTDRDRAYVMSEIASEKLMAQEAALGDQWALSDTKVREHLAAGRKPLALAALKERKLIEQRMEEIQIYKLKLAESNSVAQTAAIQQAVIQAVAVGTQAARTELIDVDDALEILEDAKAVQDQVREIAQVVADGQELEDSVLLEYEKLVAEQQTESAKDALIDQIPSPPTAVPGEKTTNAPQLIIPDEWIEG